MRLSYSASAAFWALLASTAPHSLEAKQGLEVKAKGLRRQLLASSACTIMAIEFLAKEGEPHREMKLECEMDPKDASGISGITAPLSLSPHQRADLTEMIYSGEVDPGVDMLDIEGDEITESQEVKIDPVVKMSSKVSKTPSAKAQKQRRLVDTTGNLNMLLVRVTDANGLVYSDDATTMSNEVFGTGDDPVNLKSGLEECSWNQLTVVPQLIIQNSATSDMEVAPGVIEVTIDVSLNGSSDDDIRNAVTTAVTNKLGHSLPGPYDYVLYSLENCYGTDCGWAGYAYINSWNSVYVSYYYGVPGVLMHELGHNFGLAHSGANENSADLLKEYADHTCTMGNPQYSDDGFQCFNPAKNFQLNWYDNAEITEDPRTAGYSNTLTLVGIGEYDIRGGNPVIVRLETGTGADYFVGFNRATGPNRLNDEGDDQVNIVQVEDGNGESFSQSWLRALLSQGQSYAISDFGGLGKTVTITVDSIDISTSPGTAVISISDGTATPQPTAFPTNPPTPNPTPAPVLATLPPTAFPTNPPTPNPTPAPVLATLPPTAFPTNPPTPNPTPAPVLATLPPTAFPTNPPTPNPTPAPVLPTLPPTAFPTNPPTPNPTPAPVAPTSPPTGVPTVSKSGKTQAPTKAPILNLQAGMTESIQLHRIREKVDETK